ncbi:MAG: hypothetical protein MJ052_05600, partial [Sphaerochaetaceae bacterium]|nr:hypothetical protein [Sphaerochaetaceae bacterium]
TATYETDEAEKTDETGVSEETSVSDKITEVADSLSSEVSPNPESAENSVSKGENPDSEAVAVTPLNDKGEESGKNPESEVLTDKDAVSEKVPEEVPASEASGTSSELQSAEEQGEDTNAIADLEPFKVENFTDIKKRKLEAGYLKASYSYSQKLDNNYKKNFTEGSFYTKLDGNLVIDGKVPGQFFSAKETISPSFDITKKVEGNSDVKNGSLTSNFTASVPLVGITYTLTNKVVNYKNDNGNKEVKKWDWTSENVTAHSIAISKTLGPFTLSLKQNLKPVTETLVPSVTFNHKSGFYIFADLAFKRDDSDKLVREKSNANFKFSRNNIDFKFTKASLEISFYNSYDHQKKWESYSGTQRFYFSLFNSNLSFTENLSLEKEFKVKSMSLNLAAWGNSVTMTFKDVDFTPDTLKVLLKYNLKPVYGWKNRIGFEGGFDASFTYDFNNKYGTTFMLNFSLAFAISKFLDIDVSVKTVNNSFYRYYDDGGKFSMSLLLQDLLRSFDFFGNGRRQTGFNLDSINISAVHYMEDWKLVFSLKANTVLQNSKYIFKPEITVYMQWNAIPELKVENKLKNGEWENK